MIRIKEEIKKFIIENYENMDNNELSEKTGLTKKQILTFVRNSRKKGVNIPNKKNKLKNPQTEKKLNTQQIKYIQENYRRLGGRRLAENLGLKYSTVKNFIDNHREDFNFRKNLTEQEIEKLIKDYPNKNTRELAKELGISYQHLRSSVDRLNIDRTLIKNTGVYNKELLENIKNKIGKETIKSNLFRKDFFEVIDTEEKAYWLGFLYADGCVSVYKSKKTGKEKAMSLSVELSNKDMEFLQKLKNQLGSEKELKERVIENKGKKYFSVRLSICNTNLCRDLINKGCIPRKSLILKFPDNTQVPKHLTNHFIRGYFDGDGCVSFTESKSKDKRYNIVRDTKNYVVGFVGTEDMLKSINKQFVENANCSEITLRKKGKAYQLNFTGINNFVNIFEYLYKDANIFMDRKAIKFIETIENYEYCPPK